MRRTAGGEEAGASEQHGRACRGVPREHLAQLRKVSGLRHRARRPARRHVLAALGIVIAVAVSIAVAIAGSGSGALALLALFTLLTLLALLAGRGACPRLDAAPRLGLPLLKGPALVVAWRPQERRHTSVERPGASR